MALSGSKERFWRQLAQVATWWMGARVVFDIAQRWAAQGLRAATRRGGGFRGGHGR